MAKLLALVGLLVCLVGTCLGAVNVIDIYRNQVFEYAVMKSNKPVVVFYYSSSSCPACNWSIKPLLEKMAKRQGDKMYLALVDFDKVPDLEKSQGIREMPTTRIFYKGQIMDQVEGLSWAKLVPLVKSAAKMT